ncbi:MAG: hypothetical protein PHS77_12185 [Gallionellaceae bacterium]|nr:hypothetical protein [Gallionellaceae bacterium]
MALTNTISNLTGNVLSVIGQGQQTALWQLSSQAQLTSTQAAQVASGRVDAAIRNMTAMQSWDIGDDLADGANIALSGLLGSTASLGELMSVGITMSVTDTQVTANGDGTVTVTTTTTHAPGVDRVLERLPDYSAAPAGDTGAWLAALLDQSGADVAENMAAYSASLPQQIPDFVQAGAASPALGASLVVSLPPSY